MTDMSRKNKERPSTYALMFDGDALLILPFKRIPEKANGKVHRRGPHAISVRAFVGILFEDLESR